MIWAPISYWVHFGFSVLPGEDEKDVTDQHPELAQNFADLDRLYSRKIERQNQRRLMRGEYLILIDFEIWYYFSFLNQFNSISVTFFLFSL